MYTEKDVNEVVEIWRKRYKRYIKEADEQMNAFRFLYNDRTRGNFPKHISYWHDITANNTNIWWIYQGVIEKIDAITYDENIDVNMEGLKKHVNLRGDMIKRRMEKSTKILISLLLYLKEESKYHFELARNEIK